MDALVPLRPALPTQHTLPLAHLASHADHAAAATTFMRYRARMADETRRRHDADLAAFATFCTASGAQTGAFTDTPAAWSGVTWGLVAAFVEWLLQQGYAISTVNGRLSTVKAYAKRAFQAGALSGDAYTQIATVTGLRHSEGVRVDTARATTRRGAKKAAATPISQEQAAALRATADPRDRLLMCVLLDHGFRIGEVVLLTAAQFDCTRGQLRNVYRPKVDKTQTHRLTAATMVAATAYLATWQAAPDAPLFPGDRMLRYRVRDLGAALGITALSPHDCRHYWVTRALANNSNIKAVQDAGGWNSPAMVLHYAESAAIANAGVHLD